jgi:putative transposase
MLRAYKTELDLNNKQRTMMLRCAGTARFVFNWALADRIERHKNNLPTNRFEQKRRFNTLKVEQFPWIYDVPYTIVESEFQQCDIAFQNFFRRVKKGGKPGFPNFKSKKHGINSFTLRQSIFVSNNQIKLPRIDWLRLKEDKYLPIQDVKILSANISHSAGHWFVSLQVEQPDAEISTGTHKGVIGVDVGLKVLATCSNGKVFENPKSLNSLLFAFRCKRFTISPNELLGVKKCLISYCLGLRRFVGHYWLLALPRACLYLRVVAC